MGVDSYGYGFDQGGSGHLLEDLRSLSPSEIAKIAAAWDQSQPGPAYDEAEKEALGALERADRAPLWADLRRAILDLIEGQSSLVDWKAEHGRMGQKAEAATLGGALGLLAGDLIAPATRKVLVTPLADALPWLAHKPHPSTA